jgi:hypothetical protein
MPLVGFEPTIPVFEGAEKVHAIDDAINVIGNMILCNTLYVTKKNLINFVVKDMRTL